MFRLLLLLPIFLFAGRNTLHLDGTSFTCAKTSLCTATNVVDIHQYLQNIEGEMVTLTGSTNFNWSKDTHALAGGGVNDNSLIRVLFVIVTPILLMLLVLSLFGYFRFRSLYEKEVAEKNSIQDRYTSEVNTLKNREVSIRILELERRNKLTEKIETKLTRLKEKLPTDYHGFMNATIQEVDKCKVVDLWKEFEGCFVGVHPYFIKNLSSHYPDLSANEIKICSLIRVSITSKDISEITELSVKSIEAIRTKLRKKFNLSSTDVLLGDFLGKF
jgi:DNA-binding CsgD family transcriptional regulator